MDVLRDVLLVLAMISIGLMAGVFFAYTTAVMPGLAKADDRTFVGAFQAIDRAIINPLFLSVFVGALAITVLAGAAHLAGDSRSVLPWILVAAALYLATVLITARVNVPLNDAIKAAGDPDQIDVSAARKRFDEARWARWNTVRTVLTTAALVCLGVALVVA